MRIVTAGMMMLATAAALHAQEPPAGVLPQTKIVTGGTFGFISEQLIGGTPVKGSPYSAQAVTETTQTLADGNRIVQKSTAMVYRDSLGRERREETLPAIGSFTPQGDPPQIISISDPVAGVNYSLNSRDHVAIKLPALPPLTQAGAERKLNVIVNKAGIASAATAFPLMIYRASPKPNAASNIEQLGWKLIEGVPAEGTRSTITIPAGQIGNDRPIDIVDEQWRSPDLQVIVYSKHSDPRFGETVYSLTNISRAEPPATLFQVPPDYTVRDKVSVDVETDLRKVRQRMDRKLPQ
jgi:hypothetical protein